MTEEKYLKRLEHYYDEGGRLKQYPSKRPLRELALYRLAEKFENEKDYSEKEVNDIIQDNISFSDVALIRRELYQLCYLDREPNGSRYWRIK